MVGFKQACVRAVLLAPALSLFVAFLHAGPARAQTPADMVPPSIRRARSCPASKNSTARRCSCCCCSTKISQTPIPLPLRIYRGVIHQCPKAYLAYEQRKRASNPFANSGLVKGTVGASFLRFEFASQAREACFPCDAAVIVPWRPRKVRHYVRFAKSRASGLARPASRPVLVARSRSAPNEPSRIEVPLPARAGQERSRAINAGGTWTFWVYNVERRAPRHGCCKGYSGKTLAYHFQLLCSKISRAAGNARR